MKHKSDLAYLKRAIIEMLCISFDTDLCADQIIDLVNSTKRELDEDAALEKSE